MTFRSLETHRKGFLVLLLSHLGPEITLAHTWTQHQKQ